MAMPIDIVPTRIPDVLLITGMAVPDDRGFFSEVYSQEVWDAAGIEAGFVQDNLSCSSRGTLRGMHYQIEPSPMGKFVRVLTGSVYDVAVDLREGSPTFGQWVGETLSAENRRGLWIPAGFAHGFLALEDETQVLYKCTNFYTPEAERSLHYADPAIGIDWPAKAEHISEKDADAPALDNAEYNFVYTG